MTDTRTLKQVEKAVATMRRKVAAAVRRHEKLQQRISKLQAAGSIVSMHKDAEIVAGDNEWYVKADSLNTDKEAEWNWYYILTCDEEHGYDCRCESVKPCKHITTLSESFRIEAYAVKERLEADLVLWQAEQYTKTITQRTVASLNSNQGFQLLRA
jgi:hypothetical protein